MYSFGADFLIYGRIAMKKITIIGGDNRLKILKEKLENEGYLTDTLGLYENDFADFTSSQIIVLPVPTTKDGKTVFTPLTKRTIPLEFIEANTSREQLILCCNYNFSGRNSVDYGAFDSYALLTAIPTAEGAIKIAIENTDYTLWKSDILVIGYGRVGKILANRLKALGANVTVSARKPADFGLAESVGLGRINTTELNTLPLNFDIIFNTVDIKVIDNNTLKSCKDTLFIDLSSLGGFDLKEAERLGIKAIKAPGLPGIIAPKTAAEILSNTITHIINSYN